MTTYQHTFWLKALHTAKEDVYLTLGQSYTMPNRLWGATQPKGTCIKRSTSRINHQARTEKSRTPAAQLHVPPAFLKWLHKQDVCGGISHPGSQINSQSLKGHGLPSLLTVLWPWEDTEACDSWRFCNEALAIEVLSDNSLCSHKSSIGTGWWKRFSCKPWFFRRPTSHHCLSFQPSQHPKEADSPKMQVSPGRDFSNHFKANIQVTKASPQGTCWLVTLFDLVFQGSLWTSSKTNAKSSTWEGITPKIKRLGLTGRGAALRKRTGGLGGHQDDYGPAMHHDSKGEQQLLGLR